MFNFRSQFLSLIFILGILSKISSAIKGEKCKLNNQCGKNLACSIRKDISFNSTCLLVKDQKCNNDLDCANNLNCIDKICLCKPGEYYEKSKNQCVKKKKFGHVCFSSAHCEFGLICSSIGSVKNTCLKDLGNICASNNDCANLLNCVLGKCSCSYDKNFHYDNKTHNCITKKIENEFKKCQTDLDCGSSLLACDNSPFGYYSFTCKRSLLGFCLEYSDCTNNLLCDPDFNICNCNKEQFFDMAKQECIHLKGFIETCHTTDHCDRKLVCNIKALENQKTNTCLKPFGSVCFQDHECTNSLNCINNVCACSKNKVFKEEVHDCIIESSGDFGSNCKLQTDCIQGLICSKTGLLTNICLKDQGQKCSSNNDCANLMFCSFNGTCGCSKIGSGVLSDHHGFIYSSKDHSCELVKYPNEGLNCRNDSTCQFEKSGVFCDTISNTCVRPANSRCLNDFDCSNDLICLHETCTCDPSRSFFRFSQGPPQMEECIEYKKLNEKCTEYSDCYDTLVCNLLETSNQKPFTCLKPFDSICSVDSECANNLECINGYCSCNSSSYYQNNVYDCVRKSRFADFCLDDKECDSNLGCDLQTYQCSYLEQNFCSSNIECVNDLFCNDGVCKCKANRNFNPETKHCRLLKNKKN